MTPDTNAMFAALEAELDVDLIEWEPTETGERIVGRIKSIEYVPIRDGRERMGVLHLETPNGSLARVSAGAKNLKSQLEAAKVQPGDGLALQYEGQRSPRNGGREYNAYRVATQAVGARTPDRAFKVPEGPVEDDLGLITGTDASWGSLTEQDPGF